MAAQGRGPDQTLVHMSPKEVQGLQALAMAHGGSLTINPETGLPEAGFLENILPAVAGFALDAFAPGVGEAVGGMFGLGGSAGTALTVGGISGLASGSLEKGIMAGMGAYGGASIGESMIKGGTNSLTPTNNSEYGGYGSRDAGGDTSPMSTADRLGALKTGASSAFSSPKDFLKDNKLALAAISAPVLMDTFGNKTSIPAAQETKKYNMNYVKDPVTGALYDTSGEGVTYGGVGRSTRGMAEGGVVPYDTRTDSQKALDYLMGKPGATNPMLFTHQTASEAIKPADFDTKTGGHYILDAATNTYTWIPDAVDTAGLAAAAAEKDRLAANKGGPQGGSEKGVNPFGALSPKEQQAYLNDHPMFQGITNAINGVANFGKNFGILGLLNGIGSLFGKNSVPTGTKMGGYTTPQNITPLKDALHPEMDTEDTDKSTAAQNAANAMSQNAQTAVSTNSSVTDPSQRGIALAAANDTGKLTGQQSVADMAESEGVALGPAATGGEPGDARGGFYKNGKFNFHPAQVYANGGIAALAGGGLGNLGGYSDGGQLLRGPGDGVSDSIPAKIAGNQPARLADGEFVIPARIVSELGNGSTDAGARQLYKMLDRIQSNRAKTVGKNKTATDSKSARYLPA